MNRNMLAALGAAVMSATVWAAASPAAACGGFFCNRQGIDQVGENILFSMNADGTVTTVVQIQYSGPSETFAWILPVPAEPTVDVGTDAIFRELAQRTTPRFSLSYETLGECRSTPSCWGAFDELDAAERGGPGPPMAGGTPDDDGVDVRLRANVGPYDVAVLAAGNADALRDWLGDNGYLIPPEAAGELDHYVALDHFFVALRLQKNRDAGEIQPIVLTSSNDEPCIPIRLTRIATVPDMPITAYFLAEQRYRPFNFMLVNPDLDDPGLWMGGTSYSEVVTQAVNDVGGHGFVTDYAGDVPSISLSLDPISHLRDVTDPQVMVQSIQAAGFNGDSQLLSILTRHIPPPEGVDAQQFFNCISREWCDTYDGYLNDLAFNPGLLIDELEEGIVAPRMAAQAMLDGHGHLTRLFTTMSAHEMDVDPMFTRSDELPREHSNIHEATLQYHCGPEYFQWTAPTSIVLPSGDTQHVSDGVAYYGSDSEYCEDMMERGFYPGASMETIREVAASRENRLRGGGGRCSVSPGASGLAGAGVLAFGLLAFVWRRRR